MRGVGLRLRLIRPTGLSLLRTSLVQLAGEAVNNLTPTANMGGEAVKVYLLRQHGVAERGGVT